MSRPRPPSEETVACAVIGRVAAPPSVTAIWTAPSVKSHERSRFEPGSGLACRMALLSNSLTTSTASPTTPSNIPAAVSSAARSWRAIATLAGAHGRATVPAILTSRARARSVRRVARVCRGDAPHVRARNRPQPGAHRSQAGASLPGNSVSGRRRRPDRAATRLPGRGPGRPGQPTDLLAHRQTVQPGSSPAAIAMPARDVRQPRAPRASGRA